jgi:hypothetical protein
MILTALRIETGTVGLWWTSDVGVVLRALVDIFIFILQM